MKRVTLQRDESQRSAMPGTRNAVIIGAGIGGLSVAALLAKHGFRVTVVEKNEQSGGRARVYEQDGFVFDMGPSWYLMPDVFARYFALFDKKPEDYYQLERLDPNYRIFFGTDKKVDIPARRQDLIPLFDSMTPDGGRRLEEYLGHAKEQYDIAMQEFMYRDYTSIFTFLNWRFITKGARLRILENIDAYVSRYFADEDIRKIFEYTMVFLGGSPQNTPALYAIMSHVDLDLGVWYPMGGMGMLVKALQGLGEQCGVEYRFNKPTRQIEVNEHNRACAVITDDETIAADLVVVNADYQHAETSLLPPRFRTYGDGYWNKKVMGPSAFIIYLGLGRKVEGLVHHNLYLEPSWNDHFRQIFDEPAWPDRFSYYVSCPSKTDRTVAPDGCENIFVLVPVAPGLTDTDEVRNSYYDRVMDHLGSLLQDDLRKQVLVKRIYAHRDFTQDYNAYRGTALGLSHTLFQTAVFRPAHRSKKVRNLFYTGSYTHPGVGVPMVMIASQIVNQQILEEYDR
jgi:phytoene desaturase